MISIWKKSFVAVFAAVLIVSVYFVAGILMFAGAQYNDINTKNLEEAVKIYGNFTPDAVFTDRDALAAWASRLEESRVVRDAYRVTLINRSGQVLFDTAADSSTMENHLDRPEFQAAITGGIGSARRRSATMGQDYIYAAMAINNTNNVFAGVIRLSLLVPSFFSRLLGSTLPFLLLGVIIVLAACAGLYWFSRRISRSTEVALDAELEKKSLELKAKTEEAEAEDRRREVILNSMFDGVIALDKHLKIILANPRLCSLFGVAGEKEALGLHLLSFSRSAELEDAAQRVLATGQPTELTLKRYISAVEQHFQVFAAPLKAGASDEVQGVVIVMSDITRLVKLEQVRKDFAANVSHELRTPIQVIKGFAENILNFSFDDKDEVRHFAEIIAKNAQTMENLTNDLLTLVSLEDENRPRPSMEDCAIAPLIAEAAAMVEVAARKKNIAIEISCAPELSAKLYGSLIIQALVNLLDNGIKYSKPDSKIYVAAFRESEGLIIEVKDNGIGIPAEHLGRLFERFYRVDRSRSREEGGTGLGLSIVRHIALLHNGSVEVENHAGEGSVFRVKVP
ncbi:MAG: PAS domain-containing protein [Treponema sp.]|jgi:two-component system phosphate regulon sensor histidine kinase PhoR|nr:PAS domain-containing protein [Treponema sp.]